MSQQQSAIQSSNEQQWRDYYSTQYSNQYTQYHQEPGLNYHSPIIDTNLNTNVSDHFLFDFNQLNYDSISNQDNSPIATSRYTPQSQC